jgi:hypothetical protein
VATTGGQIVASSAGRTGDTTAYETQIADATFADLGAHADTLAAAGYILTAIGRSGAAAYMLVGARAPGSAAARAVMTRAASVFTSLPELDQGFAIVGWAYDGVGSVLVAEK